MNTDLLFKLYCIHSQSGSEKKMRRFIRKYISEHCGEVEMTTDNHGNLLCVKGDSDTYPCLAAHMDQVQKSHSKDFQVVSNGHVCFGYSPKSHEQQGLGADDKNGIFVCLECLKAFDVLKVAFFVGEEVGCKGSNAVDLTFFKDCRFIIEPDRRGNSDLITSMFCGDVCSEKFIESIGYKQFGYDEDTGSVTDVGELVDRGVGISCLNLSCGYYEAHSDQEFTVLPELENCLNFVMHIVSECREVFPFTGGYGGYRGKFDYGYNYGYDYYGGYHGSYFKKDTGESTGTRTGRKSQSDEEIYWEYYFDSGMYDEDESTMRSFLEIDPTLSFEDIYKNYLTEFHAPWYFGEESCRSNLSDIYWMLIDDIEYSKMAYDDDDDNDSVVFEVNKKVS